MDKHYKVDMYHNEIWSLARAGEVNPASTPLHYIENHNAECSYAELAVEYEAAIDLLMHTAAQSPNVKKFDAVVVGLVRQELELKLKSALENISILEGGGLELKITQTHNLCLLLQNLVSWLERNKLDFDQDLRWLSTQKLVECLQEIDPRGDLFRFGLSKAVNGKRFKSYDRVRIQYLSFKIMRKDALDFITHWGAVPLRRHIRKEMQWEQDQFFDEQNFPRRY